MAVWITCTQLDGRSAELNMDLAHYITEEAGGISAICFGSGDRQRVAVKESRQKVAALARLINAGIDPHPPELD